MQGSQNDNSTANKNGFYRYALVVGSWLMQSLNWPFKSLVTINASITLIVLFAIPFLPYELLSKRETDSNDPSSDTTS